MNTIIKISTSDWQQVTRHLLPDTDSREQAAFLFAKSSKFDHHVDFEVIGFELLTADDFDAQLDDYLELGDSTRARLIKKAHDLSASLIELHSHPGPWKAAFSWSDRIGLQQTVPHMWWRLQKRPYLAIVVAPSGFDALVWLDNPKVPVALNGLLAGETLLRPTNFSLEGW